MFDLVRKSFDRPIKYMPLTSFFDELFDQSILNEVFGDSVFKVDISRNADEITVKAELPGVKKEDLSVTCEDGVLTIEAKREEVSEDSSEKYLMKETRTGSMRRSFNIGAVDPSNISTSYSDGVLSIQLKREVEEPMKKIEIT